MSDQAPHASSAGKLVWDSSPLHHAVKADRVDTLEDIASPYENFTTAAVIQELEHYKLPVDGLHWLTVMHVDGLKELQALVAWMQRVGGAASNQGEATVLAWAEAHQAVPVIDDKDARLAARHAGVTVRGVLSVVAQAVSESRMTRYAAERFVEDLMTSGARYPFPRGQFGAWAEKNGLLSTVP
jgi:predicted nucleic acid-binding protein